MIVNPSRSISKLARGDLPKMYVGPSSLLDLGRAMRLEWIVTNGLGGYASSTVLNINTRKYHGLLVAAFNPPVDRHVLLSKIDEDIRIGNTNYHFGSNEFRGVIYPDGYKRLKFFLLDPFPTFTYQDSGLFLRKEIFMPYMTNMVAIHYDVLNSLDRTAILNVYPLVNARHFHETTDRHAQQLSFVQERIANGIMLETRPPKGCLAIISTDGSYTQGANTWVEKVYFRIDDSRGESCTDDNWQPGFFTIEAQPKERKEFYIAAIGGRTRDEITSYHPAMLEKNQVKRFFEGEIIRRQRLLRNFCSRNPNMSLEDWLSWLILSADSFIVSRKSTGTRSVIAGYHWFEDWGRDALISLPGLTLVIEKFRDAEEILLTFKQHCKDGLIPNRFRDQSGEEPVYDSADASLWFFNAVFQYLKYTGNLGFVRRELWDTMQDVVETHIRGARFGIRMDDDGLLLHGPRLTWMDVQVDGNPVTPRAGKAVEIQALWFNALRIMETLASRLGREDDAQTYASIAEKARVGFHEKFWWSRGDYLLDVVEKEGGDPSLRPNQIIAAYLDFSMLDDCRRVKVVDAVWNGLWGTYGLRTLSSNDPRYIAKYGGGFVDRDIAYHSGTVWAWLLGPFVTAFLKVKEYGDYWRKYAFDNFLLPLFLEETHKAGLGTISEVFDGDPPHSPNGCISQAWSVAEPLRAYVEDILLKRPPHEKAIKHG